jgi:hypothetical protein
MAEVTTAVPNRRDVLAAMGACLAVYQEIEKLLKQLLLLSRIEYQSDNLQEAIKKRREKYGTSTMGVLVGAFVDEVLVVEGHEDDGEVDEAITEITIRQRTLVVGSLAFVEGKKQSLKQLVDERNDLAHSIALRIDWESPASCSSAIETLERYQSTACFERDFLTAVSRDLNESRMVQAAFLITPAAQETFELLFLQQSGLAQLLVTYAGQNGRQDGWTLLSSAGNYVKQHAPVELENKFERFGYSQLHKIVEASQLFDLVEEECGAGKRWLYRVKPEAHLDDPLIVLGMPVPLAVPSKNA